MRAALWYRWAVSYRDSQDRPRLALIDSPSRRAAITVAQTTHPRARAFTATRLSARPRS